MATVSINELAKRAGLSPCQCRKCGASLQTDRALAELFQQILAAVKAGDEVKVKNFGSFKAHTLKGRTFDSPVVKREVTSPDTLVMKYRQTRKVKAFLNGDDD